MRLTMRQFNKEVYDQVDKKAKEVLSLVLMRKGYGIVGGVEQELYNTDVVAVQLVEEYVKTTRFECEVRKRHYYDRFIDGYFKEIHIPARKMKNISDWYVVFPDSYDELLLIPMKVVKNSPIHAINMPHGLEDFICVEIKHAIRYFIMKDGSAEKQGRLV